MPMISFYFFLFISLLMLILFMEQKWLPGSVVKAQKATLLIASLIFTGYVNLWFPLILMLQAWITWYSGRVKKRIPWGIFAMVLFLAFFKYTNFFYASFSALIGVREISLLKIILPLGISFYTFSAISYLADIRKGIQESVSLPDLSLYLSFFPKLTSGPIQRSEDFFRQINSPRKVCLRNTSVGAQIFLFGMFKKMVLADHLAVFVNQVYETPAAFGSSTVLLAVFSYALQIYFDFSGYSDMAIGAAKLLDINLPRNFNLPYLSHNVSEFWKRWHITLSSWLQEYVYFPLGGNRKGKIRTYLNLILTMVIGGIWHGADWTYIIWGLLHGIALVIHKFWVLFSGSSGKKHSSFANICSIFLTFVFTSFCWIFFRAESVGNAMEIIHQILKCTDGIQHFYLWTPIAAIVLMGSSCIAWKKSKALSLSSPKTNQSSVSGFYPLVDLNTFWGQVGFFIFCGLLFSLAYTGISPFIYGAY